MSSKQAKKKISRAIATKPASRAKAVGAVPSPTPLPKVKRTSRTASKPVVKRVSQAGRASGGNGPTATASKPVVKRDSNRASTAVVTPVVREPLIDKQLRKLAESDATRERDRELLFEELCKHSGLPGIRENQKLAEAVGFACLELAKGDVKRTQRMDRLVSDMVHLDADRAPGGTPSEFIPVCGVRALGIRIARPLPEETQKNKDRWLALLMECADDLRFRVRDAVPLALTDAFEFNVDTLLQIADEWLTGFFQAAAILQAIAQPTCNEQLSSGDARKARAIEVFSQALILLVDAQRSAVRYPGYKALAETLPAVAKILAPRLGRAFFECIEEHARTQDARTRDLVSQLMSAVAMQGRTRQDQERVQTTLHAYAPPLRDPTVYVGPTRNRSKKLLRTR
jgi:hypothetical protein